MPINAIEVNTPILKRLFLQIKNRKMELILQYFPNLTSSQVDSFAALFRLYNEWNERINVISRKDMENFYERHVLHSLGIAKVLSFQQGTKVMDIGTGGGFPGIPLAILFPETNFLLIDSIGKKIKVVNEVVQAIDLKNVRAIQSRAEDVNEQFDFVVCRAVIALPAFLVWSMKNIRKGNSNQLENGILYLKGGELQNELAPIKQPVRIFDLSQYFEEEFFKTKKVVYIKKS